MNTSTARANLPPADLASPADVVIRATAARYCAFARGLLPEAAVDFSRRAWPRDAATELVLSTRGAVTPTTTAASAIAATSVGGFLASLRTSASGKLINAGTRIPISNVSSITLPGIATYPTVPFVEEGAPAPVGQAIFNAATLGPLFRMSIILSASEELNQVAVVAIESLFADLLRESADRALDAALFADTAASSARPAGLLDGLVTLVPTSGGGVAALAGDVQKLVDELVAAGAGDAPMLFMSPGRVAKAKVLVPGVDIPIVASPTIAGTRIIAVDAGAFVFGFSNEVDIRVGREAVLHMESENPQAIGVSGSTTLPIRSMWQTNSIAMMLNLRCSWALRAPAVSFIDSPTW